MPKGKAPRVPAVVLAGDYAAGDTLRDMAKRYGVSFQSLAIQMRNAEIELRPKSANARKYADRACERCGATYHPRYAGQRFCGRACTRGPRQAFCKRGHPLVEGNLRPRYGKLPRRCIACEKLKQKEYRERKAHGA